MSFKIPYGKQYINDDDIEAVVATLKSDFLTQGPRVSEFEQAFAKYTDAQYAVAVANGTAALHLATLALGVQPGSKIITTPITFSASANCVRYCGGEVTFADIDPQTVLLDVEKVRTLLEESPQGTYQGIIPVDFAGYPLDLEAFRQLADEHNLWLIEDACHAPGGYFTDSHGTRQFCGNGAYADLSVFSFHPVKHIACGEGGMITTNNKELYDKLLQLRTHGITKAPDLLEENHGGWYYEMQNLGFNYRLSDILATLGTSQLKHASERLEKRRAIAKNYDKAFANTMVRTIQAPTDEEGHAYHLYVIRTENRKGLYDFLRENQIFAQVHYIPVHLQPYYQQFGWKKGDFPAAEKYYAECLSLPMYPTLSKQEQNFVIEKILEFVN